MQRYDMGFIHLVKAYDTRYKLSNVHYECNYYNVRYSTLTVACTLLFIG